jgi:hypothetical protein
MSSKLWPDVSQQVRTIYSRARSMLFRRSVATKCRAEARSLRGDSAEQKIPL